MGFCVTSICTTTRSPTSSNKSQQSNSINLIYLLKFVSKLFALDKNRGQRLPSIRWKWWRWWRI